VTIARVADEAGTTGLGRRRREGTSEPPPEAPPTGAPAPPATSEDPAETRLGERRRGRLPDAPSGPDEVVRFGPGVPTTPSGGPTSPNWGATGTRRRRRRSRSWVGGLLTLLAVAAVLAWLLTRQPTPLEVRGLEVTANPAAATCGATVDIVGTVTTDGHGGTFRYQWLRSDGQKSDTLSQTVPRDTTTTQVHLSWAVSGQGRFDGHATLRIVDPAPAEAQGGFAYACS
jgi:hypothetical protein